MARILSLLRNAVFLVWLAAAMAATAIGATVWAVQLSATVANMSANAAATAVRQRREIARAVMRTKAKARIRRAVVAVPVVGVGAMAYFEERDYREWQDDHPEGTRAEYACEISQLTADVVDEVLGELPDLVRPPPNLVLEWMPECTPDDS